MNYFDLLPSEIVDYIYEINHKNITKDLIEELQYKLYFSKYKFYGNETYLNIPIFVRKREEDKFITKCYPKYIIWQYLTEERRLHNTVTLLKTAYTRKKKEILFYSFTEGVKLYKSWTKKKMIDTIYNEGRLFEVVVKCINY
jgi:hypothetical protein